MREFFIALFVFGLIALLFFMPVLVAVGLAAIAWWNRLDFWHTVMFFGGIALAILAIITIVRRAL